MLEDTNLLDGAHILFLWISNKINLDWITKKFRIRCFQFWTYPYYQNDSLNVKYLQLKHAHHNTPSTVFQYEKSYVQE